MTRFKDRTKTSTELLENFSYHNKGIVEPQYLRDLITSLIPDEGGLYIATPGATTISAINTWTKLAGTTAEDHSTDNLTVSTSNRITYIGESTRHCDLVASVTLLSAAGTIVVGAGIAKNGTILPNSEIQGVATTVNPAGLTVFIGSDVVTGDYFEVFTVNRVDGSNITATKMFFHATTSMK